MAAIAATVWFFPGWLRTAEPRKGVLESVSDAFPEACVEFKKWDGDNVVWPLAVDAADKEAWRFAPRPVAPMSKATSSTIGTATIAVRTGLR